MLIDNVDKKILLVHYFTYVEGIKAKSTSSGFEHRRNDPQLSIPQVIIPDTVLILPVKIRPHQFQ